MENKEPEEDQDIIRIRSKILILNNVFKQGFISMLIKLGISYLVTLEVSNGVETITVQEVLTIFKQRINELNKLFDILCFTIKDLEDKELIAKEKHKFRKSIYKLFDLRDIVNLMIEKCVTMSKFGISKILNIVNTTYLDPVTVNVVDAVIFADEQKDFEKRILEYIGERVITITDPVKRKEKKIEILTNILEMVKNEP